MTELHLSELSDQLDVTLDNSQIVKLALTWVLTPKAMQSNKDHAVYSGLFSSKSKCKPEVYDTVCVYVALSCCLSAKQRTKSKQCKVSTKQGQRLDHVTKLEAYLPRLIPGD